MKKGIFLNNRPLIGISFLLLCGALSMGIVRPMLPLYLTNITLEPSLVGIVVAVSMAGMIIGESVSGMLSDRFGLRLPLLLSTVACGLLLFAFVLGTALPFLLLIGFFWGALRVIMVGPVRAYMAEIAPPQRKATYIAISGAILSLSRGVGALPGGIIADSLGYDWVFFIAGTVAVLGSLGLIIGRRTPTAPVYKNVLEPPGTGSKRWLPLFILIIIIGIFGFFNISILLTYVPLLGTETPGLTATRVGVIFTVNGLATMAFSLPGGMIADRIGKRPTMIAGLGVCAVAMAGIASIPGFYGLLIWGVLHALGMAFFMTAAIGLLSDLISRGRLATYIGLYGGIGENSGLMLGAAVGGFIWEWLGAPATFISAAIACVVGVILILLLSKKMGNKNRQTGDTRLSSVLVGDG